MADLIKQLQSELQAHNAAIALKSDTRRKLLNEVAILDKELTFHNESKHNISQKLGDYNASK